MSKQRRQPHGPFKRAKACGGAWLACAALAVLGGALAAGEWEPPAQPKDDRHWYPEFPGPDEPLPELKNGSFEEAEAPKKGLPPAPLGWAHPDGLTSFWTSDPAAPERGKFIVLDTDVLEEEAKKRQAAMRAAAEKGEDPPPAPEKSEVGEARQYGAIGATYGVSFYSSKIACAPKQAYKISFDYRGPGGAKVWVRGWGPFRGEERRRWETIVNCRTAGDGWRHFEQAFHPTRRPQSKDKVAYIEVSYLRVMLYAYWPRGRYAFDNVKIEAISDEEYERLKALPAEPK
ncbi:MAG: hypothetical protein HS116_06075 [Planctomycetes bacterium]|nr:hypothetical protein [Planctomycetota bacterium]